MPPDQAYPSPSAAQVSGGSGPFFQQNGDPGPIPNDLQQLQAAADRSLDNASMVQSLGHGGYPHQPDDQNGMVPVQPTSPERLAQGMAQGVLNMGDGQDFSPVAQVGPRKRSKVSRACDECRRKKIRCDAMAEIPDEPCSSCKRTGAHCQFSRQPMKRGPSKGYIKELADRLNNIESQMGQQQSMAHPDVQYMQGLQDDSMAQLSDFSPPPGAQMTRKRTLSMSESRYLREQPYAPARNNVEWATEQHRQLGQNAGGMPHPQTPQQIQAELRAPYSPNDGSALWRDPGRRDDMAVQYESTLREPDTSIFIDWEDSVIDEYYRIIHQTFPFLPNSKTRLRERLANCVATLRDAFLVALDCAVRSSPLSSVRANTDPRSSTRKAAELVSAASYDKAANGSVSADLVYCQTLILMALESDNHGPATMRGQIGPPRSEWLGRAIGIATHLKLNRPRENQNAESSDLDSDERLGRRIWWTLFILDRWHACSAATLMQIPEHSSTLVMQDQMILGDTTYHIARLSYVLGHFCSIVQQTPSMMSTDPAGPIISLTLMGEVDRFRESVDHLLHQAPNLIHLSYWYAKLLILRLTSSTTPHQLLGPATRMASILNSVHTTITPLNHHFAALSAHTLMQLCNVEETRVAAEKGVEDIVQALNARRGLMSREDSTGWDSAIRDLVNRKGPPVGSLLGERGGAGIAPLQHLADVASHRRAETPTGAGAEGEGLGQVPISPDSAAKQQSEGSTTGIPFDPSTLTRYGYLAALVQETHGTR